MWMNKNLHSVNSLSTTTSRERVTCRVREPATWSVDVHLNRYVLDVRRTNIMESTWRLTRMLSHLIKTGPWVLFYAVVKKLLRFILLKLINSISKMCQGRTTWTSISAKEILSKLSICPDTNVVLPCTITFYEISCFPSSFECHLMFFFSFLGAEQCLRLNI